MSNEEEGAKISGIRGNSGSEQEVVQKVDVLNFADSSLAMDG